MNLFEVHSHVELSCLIVSWNRANVDVPSSSRRTIFLMNQFPRDAIFHRCFLNHLGLQSPWHASRNFLKQFQRRVDEWLLLFVHQFGLQSATALHPLSLRMLTNIEFLQRRSSMVQTFRCLTIDDMKSVIRPDSPVAAIFSPNTHLMLVEIVSNDKASSREVMNDSICLNDVFMN